MSVVALQLLLRPQEKRNTAPPEVTKEPTAEQQARIVNQVEGGHVPVELVIAIGKT